MANEEPTRRSFLQRSGAFAGTAWMKAGLPGLIAVAESACSARDAGAAFEVLTSVEARELAAIAARILPTTDTPGATEAGVIWFIDKVYGSIFASTLERDRAALAEFLSGVASAYSGRTFADLDAAAQDAYLTTRQHTDFFANVRFLTIAGVFALTTWGGNRDGIGWQLIGMNAPPHGWSSPFGYYDTEYLESQNRGG